MSTVLATTLVRTPGICGGKLRIDGTRIGRTAAQFIDDRAEGRPVDQPIVDIGFEIVSRASA